MKDPQSFCFAQTDGILIYSKYNIYPTNYQVLLCTRVLGYIGYITYTTTQQYKQHNNVVLVQYCTVALPYSLTVFRSATVLFTVF